MSDDWDIITDNLTQAKGVDEYEIRSTNVLYAVCVACGNRLQFYYYTSDEYNRHKIYVYIVPHECKGGRSS